MTPWQCHGNVMALSSNLEVHWLNVHANRHVRTTSTMHIRARANMDASSGQKENGSLDALWPDGHCVWLCFTAQNTRWGSCVNPTELWPNKYPYGPYIYRIYRLSWTVDLAIVGLKPYKNHINHSSLQLLPAQGQCHWRRAERSAPQSLAPPGRWWWVRKKVTNAGSILNVQSW